MNTTIKGVYSFNTTTTYTINVLNNSGLTVNDKCIWIAASYNYAPTFQMKDTAGAKGVATKNW
tara:strand:+ start:646 stop:834 length:189 start_codon:yes stop_codon:yes gene_type:complete